MNNLIINFAGMSLILSGTARSEALLISTSGSVHKHKHNVLIQGQATQVDGAVMWIEENGVRLNGALVDAGTMLARFADLTPGISLQQTLTTNSPESTFAWQNLVSVWLRIPDGTLTTTPTPGPGGGSLWEFPPFGGQPAKKRQLTQEAVLTKTGVAGPVRLAILHQPNGQPAFINVPRNAMGDYEVSIVTEYSGPMLPEPNPGSPVLLSEMQLLYNCLNPQQGPIPSAIWPGQVRRYEIFKWLSRGNNQTLLTDPVTGICPIGFASV